MKYIREFGMDNLLNILNEIYKGIWNGQLMKYFGMKSIREFGMDNV
jgi:hypothetical protein